MTRLPLPAASDTAPMPLRPGETKGQALDWDQLPLMNDSIAQRLALLLERHRRDAAADDACDRRWSRTQAAEFDALPLATSFHEDLQGLKTREMDQPAVFRYFFGTARRG